MVDVDKCVNDHDMTPENTGSWSRGPGKPRQRVCLTCKREQQRPHSARHRVAKRASTPATFTPSVARLRDAPTWVYFISDDFGHVKIGVAADVEMRRQDMQIANPGELRIEAVLPGDETLEYALHDKFAADWVRGEWFVLSPAIALYIDVLNDLSERIAG